MNAKIVALITPSHPWGVRPDDPYMATLKSHTDAEKAMTMGLWPFVCPYCGDKFSADRGQFPYCSPICAINAENS